MGFYEDIEKIQTLLWMHDDRMEQNTLFEAQDLLADLALRVATKEGKVEQLVSKFPFLYKEIEK